MSVIVRKLKKDDSVEVIADHRVGTVRNVSEIDSRIRVQVEITEHYSMSAGQSIDLPREWFDSEELKLI
jgi:hypothetical protein